VSSADQHVAPAAGSDPTIAVVADLVGDKWSMLVVRDVFRGVRRFDDLCADLGVARAVLATRLRKLVDAGVLTKVPYHDRPVRHEYRLTPMGLELSPMLVALLRWGDRWLGEGEATAVLVHAPCGTELHQAFWCPACKCTFGPTAIRSARPARVAAAHRERTGSVAELLADPPS
jgi:DNA-binding HxlR family transcriptional regulator